MSVQITTGFPIGKSHSIIGEASKSREMRFYYAYC
nr:MAG TPA: hypothetical protein [Caudoviricetes sp.]DAG70401.1 MAG TPA: hypothetical protein [Caudoviricetes sp.]